MNSPVDRSRYLYTESAPLFKFRMTLCLMLCWTLAQLLIPIKFIPYHILIEVEFLKMTIPIGLVVFSSLLYFDKLQLRSIFWPFYLLVLLVLFNTVIKLILFHANPSMLQEAAKYIIWIFSMFILFPTVFDSLYKARIFLRFSVSLILCIFMLLFVEFFYLSENAQHFIVDDRLEFVYGNPLYSGGILYALFCSSIMLRALSSSRFERRATLLVMILSLWMIYMANARTFMVATLVFFVVYGFISGKNIQKALIASFLILIFIIAMFLFAFYEIDINSVLSNRLAIWYTALSDKTNLMQVIFGIHHDFGYTKSLSIESAESVVQTFQRYAIDNVYIEIFINIGLFGLGLFLLGFQKLFRGDILTQLRSADQSGQLARVAYIAYGVLVSLMFAGIPYGMFPSFGNVINSVVFPIVISIILALNKYAAEIRRPEKT